MIQLPDVGTLSTRPFPSIFSFHSDVNSSRIVPLSLPNIGEPSPSLSRKNGGGNGDPPGVIGKAAAAGDASNGLGDPCNNPGLATIILLPSAPRTGAYNLPARRLTRGHIGGVNAPVVADRIGLLAEGDDDDDTRACNAGIGDRRGGVGVGARRRRRRSGDGDNGGLSPDVNFANGACGCVDNRRRFGECTADGCGDLDPHTVGDGGRCVGIGEDMEGRGSDGIPRGVTGAGFEDA